MADLFQAFVEFWVDVILLVPRLIFYAALNLLEFVLNWLAGNFDVDPANYVNAIPADVLYFTTLFQLHNGLPLIVTALIARFILRRIPVIG